MPRRPTARSCSFARGGTAGGQGDAATGTGSRFLLQRGAAARTGLTRRRTRAGPAACAAAPAGRAPALAAGRRPPCARLIAAAVAPLGRRSACLFFSEITAQRRLAGTTTRIVDVESAPARRNGLRGTWAPAPTLAAPGRVVRDRQHRPRRPGCSGELARGGRPRAHQTLRPRNAASRRRGGIAFRQRLKRQRAAANTACVRLSTSSLR